MPKKLKKFIDRKNAVTFHLVHRSLRDPLAEDESAPQRVLVPTSSDNKDKKKQLEEQQKFGIYYDDDYNYLQHLREVDTTMEWVETEASNKQQPKLQLPSSVFASKVEDEVELINKSFAQSVDADVVAAMEDDFDFDNPENELEDNFLDLANREANDSLSVIEEEEECESESEESLVGSEDGNEVEFSDDLQEETKVRSTYDILTSSVRNRNKNLRFIDAQCEKVLADWEISEDEDDENQQFMSSEVLQKYCEEFLEGQPKVLLDQDRDIIEVTKRLAQQMGSLSDEEYEEIEIPVKGGWSMSVNSTSTTCNQPKLIPVPRNTSKKTHNLTSASLSKHDKQFTSESDESDSLETESIASRVSSLSIRPKSETPEEKRERKRNLREFRYERRQEKKLNTLAFKREYLKQVQMDRTKRLNATGKKIL